MVLVVHSFSLFSFSTCLHLVVEVCFVFMLSLFVKCMLLFGFEAVAFNVIECKHIINVQKRGGTSCWCWWKRRSLSTNLINRWIHGIPHRLIFPLSWFILMKRLIISQLALSVWLILVAGVKVLIITFDALLIYVKIIHFTWYKSWLFN